MRTRQLDEAIDAVTEVYCPHRVQAFGPARDMEVTLEVAHATLQPVVHLSYGVPVAIDAGTFPRLFLMMHCAQGAASARQGGRDAEWRMGQTLPFSAGLETQLRFDRAFVQQGIRLDLDQLEKLCARMIGRPLDRPLQFELRPFSAMFETIWQRTLNYLLSQDKGVLPLTGPARAAFDEYLLTLLLTQHPHNFSEDLAQPVAGPVPGVVRRAERFMRDRAATPITVTDVAAHLDITLRSLQQGFRQWRATTPQAALRRIRLDLARDLLLAADREASVTEIALSCGFSHLGRFSAYYQSAFGEPPSATLRRRRPRLLRAAARHGD